MRRIETHVVNVEGRGSFYLLIFRTLRFLITAENQRFWLMTNESSQSAIYQVTLV
jgi:hypothetical protein